MIQNSRKLPQKGTESINYKNCTIFLLMQNSSEIKQAIQMIITKNILLLLYKILIIIVNISQLSSSPILAYQIKGHLMKFTHHAITSINVQKVQNIYTSFTRAGNGDDTHRRQRQKEKYINCKKEQQDKQEQVRQEFLREREEKLRKNAELTDKRKDKRIKKKERQKQLKNKIKLLKKLEGEESGSDSMQEEKDEVAQTGQQLKE